MGQYFSPHVSSQNKTKIFHIHTTVPSMTSPWSDNIFITSLMNTASSKKKSKNAVSTVATTSHLVASSLEQVKQDQHIIINGSAVAAGVQHQVLQQQQFTWLTSLVPAAILTSGITSFSTQAARSRPNSHAGGDISQSGSSLSLVDVSQSASSLSFGGISHSIASVPGADILGSGSSFAALTLQRMTSSLMPSGDHHCPTTLCFSAVDDIDNNNNHENFNDTNVDESTLEDDQTDHQENNNDGDYDYTQQHDFVQEHDTNDQYNVSANVISNGTPPEWEDIPPDIIMATVKKLKPELLEGKGLFYLWVGASRLKQSTLQAEVHQKRFYECFRRWPHQLALRVILGTGYPVRPGLIIGLDACTRQTKKVRGGPGRIHGVLNKYATCWSE
jgi:hypothetical protein